MKLFFTRTISLIVAALMINLVVAGTLYAQSYNLAANTKITQHQPTILIKDESKIGGGESWFSKYKWWLLAGLVVVVGGAAAAGGGGGGGGGSSDPPGNGGTIDFDWND